MNVRKKFIVAAVTLLVIQLFSVKALNLDQSSEDSQIGLNNVTKVLPSTSLPLDEQISENKENLVITKTTKNINQKSDIYYSADTIRADKIIVDIQSQHFNRALRKMQRLKDDLQGTMNYIIHKVYDGKEGNLYLILQFVDSNDNITSSLAIYQSLNYEMNINDHNSYLGRLKLMKSFNDKTADENSIPANDLNKRKLLKTELDSRAGNSTADVLKEALKTNNSAAISTISENIYNNDPILFHRAMRQVLQEDYDEINKDYLLVFFMNHKYASQSVYTYSALWGALIKRKLLHRSYVVYLASALKKALDKGVSDRHAAGVGNTLKLTLPKSVYNIVFETSKLCIVHAHLRTFKLYEHLIASENEHDSNRREIYTWVDGGSVAHGYWFIEQHEDVFYIKNSYFNRKENMYRTEYLYAAYFTDQNNDDERRVFSWIPGKPDDNQFNWKFIPSDNDTVFIKNANFNQYLYASNKKEGDQRRKVYTKSKVDWRSAWRIVKC